MGAAAMKDVGHTADCAVVVGGEATPPAPVADNAVDDPRPIPINHAERRCKYRAEPVFLDEVLGPADGTTARYRKIKTIGKGAFGEAYIVERNPLFPMPLRQRETSEDDTSTSRVGDSGPCLFVAKVMDLASMAPDDRRYAQSEIMCLARNDHFAIIRYYEHFFVDEDSETIIIITEFAQKGDLHRVVYQKESTWNLSENEVGTFFVQLLLGLDHIHRNRMIHRDIKTANIFLTSQGLLKLGDFGFSRQYDSTVSNPIACTFLGTSYYLAPEMWKGQRYGKKTDIWAAGIVLCELLGRRRPFEADSLPKMKELVLTGAMWLPPTFPDAEDAPRDCTDSPKQTRYISKEMREILELTLQQDPEKRPSASQLLKTPLMQHYLCVFQRRMNRLMTLDDEMEAEYKTDPAKFGDSPPKYNFSMETRALVLQGIAEGEKIINLETEREMANSDSPRVESTVYKETVGGTWKERYLILADGFLTMTLAKGKIAAGSGERSKKVPLEVIKSVVPVVLDISVFVEVSGSSSPVQTRYAFAISTQCSESILFATRTEQERDQWVSALIVALKMD